MAHRTDDIRELLVQLQQGSAEADAVLYARLKETLYWLAVEEYHLCHEDAEDVVQDTFRRVRERINTYNVEKGGAAWIKQIFYHIVIDRIRELYRLRKREVPFDERQEV